MCSASEKPKVIVICGPTGIGKTAVGIKLAGKFGGEIITKHSGKIWVESEEGRWINFLFTLPKEGIKNPLGFSR